MGNKNVFRVSPKENTLKIFLNNKNNTSVVCSLFSLCDRTVLFVYKQHCVLYPTVRVLYFGETECVKQRGVYRYTLRAYKSGSAVSSKSVRKPIP